MLEVYLIYNILSRLACHKYGNELKLESSHKWK